MLFCQQAWAQQDASSKFKVVIDAGHGGHDPGTVGKKVKEKDIALAIALRLSDHIQTQMPDVEVIFTRKTDVFVELFRRAQIANQAKADLFISIHCNGVKNTRPMGTETWVMGLHKSDATLR
jgi:N-acetylmuramoyl-L-alanine amidase